VNILGRLFERRQKPARCAIVAGNGQFNLYVASLAQQRMELERLYRARTGDPYRLPALLIPQPTSARGTDTVAVRVGDTTVGYLLHTAALEFLTALRVADFERAACAAMIVVRPDLQLGNQAFRVRLDAEVPFKLVDPANQKSAPTRAAGGNGFDGRKGETRATFRMTGS
jgi:hypothetical protein